LRPDRVPVVAGIVLAGGLSRRYGTNKLIEPFRGKPLLQWTVEAALRSHLASVNVVLGHEHDKVGSALAALTTDPRLTLTVNESFADGQSTSIACGLARLAPDCDGAMFMVGDQPLIDSSVIDRLISAFAASKAGICFPSLGTRRGNPVIFTSQFFSELRQLSGDSGGRIVIDRHPEACVPLAFSSAAQFSDIDQQADLEALCSHDTAAASQLVQSLCLHDSRVIALCGSGGKTGLMSALVRAFARDPSERILATATTKFGIDERTGPWRAWQIGDANALRLLGERYTTPILAFHDLDVGRQRLLGFSVEIVDAVARDSEFTRIIVEADGSRRRPLKAPDANEPVFPAAADTVIAVAGMSGLGRPLDDAAVFRPQRWSALTGQKAGAPVTPVALARMIAHPDGLMRRTPPQAKRCVFLNQADTSERQSLANAVIDALAAMADRPALDVAIGQLQPTVAVHAVHHLAIEKDGFRERNDEQRETRQ
jgi:probable selenium-dependent hydroxylase accessory protein YqeC